MSILRKTDKAEVLAGIGAAPAEPETPAEPELNPSQTLALALALEVNVDVDPDQMEITTDPENIPAELEEAIKGNRDTLIKILLENRLIVWLEKLGVHAGRHVAPYYAELEVYFKERSLLSYRELLRNIALRAAR